MEKPENPERIKMMLCILRNLLKKYTAGQFLSENLLHVII